MASTYNESMGSAPKAVKSQTTLDTQIDSLQSAVNRLSRVSARLSSVGDKICGVVNTATNSGGLAPDVPAYSIATGIEDIHNKIDAIECYLNRVD